MKTVFVLFSKKTSPSGRALALKMTEMCPANFKIHYGTSKILSRVIRDLGNRYPDFIVNMGEFKAEIQAVSKPSGTPVVLNHPSCVGRSSNKRGSRITFREENIPAPELWENSYTDIPAKAYPVVGRTTNHTKANGFWLCDNAEQARRAHRAGATHFLKFIPGTKEYRLHVIASNKKENRGAEDYVSIKMSEKVFSAAAKKPGYDIIKNHDNGWVFVGAKEEPRKGLFKEMRLIAKKAVCLFGLEWGAVDVMYDAKEDKIHVLEINTSPCLTDATANTKDKYAEWIMHLTGAVKKDLTTYEAAKQKAVNKAAEAAKIEAVQAKRKKTDTDILRSFMRRMGTV